MSIKRISDELGKFVKDRSFMDDDNIFVQPSKQINETSFERKMIEKKLKSAFLVHK